MKRYELTDFTTWASRESPFEVTMYHLKLEPAECVEAAGELEMLAGKIRRGVWSYTGKSPSAPTVAEIREAVKELEGKGESDPSKWIRLPNPDDVLRDEFAMAALTGLIARPGTQIADAPTAATWVYRFADAMLEARKK